MKNEILNIDGTQWLVREARSQDDAETAIAYARASGSVGSKHMVNGEVTADVVRVNSDGTELKPYATAY